MAVACSPRLYGTELWTNKNVLFKFRRGCETFETTETGEISTENSVWVSLLALDTEGKAENLRKVLKKKG